jgi:hypothetical protein
MDATLEAAHMQGRFRLDACSAIDAPCFFFIILTLDLFWMGLNLDESY